MLLSSTLKANWVTMEENLSALCSAVCFEYMRKLLLVNETLRPETETRPRRLTFSPRRDRDARPRRSHISPRPRRDRDVGKMRLETVSRPRRRDRDYIPRKRSVITCPHCRRKVRLSPNSATVAVVSTVWTGLRCALWLCTVHCDYSDCYCYFARQYRTPTTLRLDVSWCSRWFKTSVRRWSLASSRSAILRRQSLLRAAEAWPSSE